MALRILPLFGRNKEKETVQLFLEHVDIVKKMSDPLKEAVKLTFEEKKFKLVSKKAEEIKALEKKADAVRKKTAVLLYEGAFLPVVRSRLYDLSGRIDNVCDKINNVANTLHYLKDKKVSSNVTNIISKLADNASRSAELIQPALKALFDNKPEFQSLNDKISHLEQKSDIYQREMFDKILFDKKMNPVTIHIIGWVGHTLSEVCDEAKHVSDTMSLLKIMGLA